MNDSGWKVFWCGQGPTYRLLPGVGLQLHWSLPRAGFLDPREGPGFRRLFRAGLLEKI